MMLLLQRHHFCPFSFKKKINVFDVDVAVRLLFVSQITNIRNCVILKCFVLKNNCQSITTTTTMMLICQNII